MSSSTPDQAPDLSTRSFALWLVLCCGLHWALAMYFAPPSVVFSDTPITGGDYSTHGEQTFRVIEGLSGWGKSWVYDVRLLAGFPNGTVFDADNKAWELFTYALHSLGLSQGRAFNLFVWLVFVLVPLPLAAAARLFGLRRLGAVLAALMGTALFFFDSLLHWLTWVGTLSFLLASYLSPLALALFHRFMVGRETRTLLWLTPLLGALHLIHPYVFFVLGPSMLVSCVQARGSITKQDVARLAAMCLAVVAINAYWLVPALRHFHYVLDSSYLMSADLRQLALDYVGWLSDVGTTGVIANHTAFRVLVFAACAAGLYLARKDSRLAAAALLQNTWLWLLALAYLGEHLPLLQQIQPYRFMVAAMFVAVIPAAHAFSRIPLALPWRSLSTTARALAVVALVSITQHLAGQVLYFFPHAMPKVRWFRDDVPSPISATGFTQHPEYRLTKEHKHNAAVARFVDARHAAGRIAVQDAALGEDLAGRTRASILGGFWFCNLEHSYANPFRKLLERDVSPDELRLHMESYAVRFVVLTFPEPAIDQNKELFEEYAQIGTYRIYRTKVPVNYLAQGTGVVSASTNRIAVTGSDPNTDLVLRFHWHEALRCTKGCSRALEKADNPSGRVPFIRAPAPHDADVVIENSYEM